MQLGTSISPLAGGFVSHYASWRVMQLILTSAALFFFVLVLFYLPETIHPGLTTHQNTMDRAEEGVNKKRTKFVILNPFKSLDMLLSPVVLLSVCSSLPNFTYSP